LRSASSWRRFARWRTRAQIEQVKLAEAGFRSEAAAMAGEIGEKCGLMCFEPLPEPRYTDLDIENTQPGPG